MRGKCDLGDFDHGTVDGVRLSGLIICKYLFLAQQALHTVAHLAPNTFHGQSHCDHIFSHFDV